MPVAKLIIEDEVNISFKDIDTKTRRKMVQALKYFIPYAKYLPSYKLGRWDGSVSFCSVGGSTYLNLLDKILPVLVENGYTIDEDEIEDRRVKYNFEFDEITEDYLSSKGHVWPEKHNIAGQPIILRDYQVEIVNKFLKNLQCIQEVATGAGKTLITATLSSVVEKYGRTLLIVPSKSLVEQTEADYKALQLDVGVYYGERKERGHTHTICTWQSLGIMDKKDQDDQSNNLQDFIEDVVCIMVDETHSAKAEVLKKLLTGPFANIPIRLGLTGTIPKEEFEFASLLASIGPVIHKLSAHTLQENDVLAQCNIEILQLVDNKEFKSYPQERTFLLEDPVRLKWIAEFIEKIVESGNTLILVPLIPVGKILEQMIPNSIFVSGSMKTENRQEHYDEVKNSQDKIIIATYGVAAVGINIPRIFNLVLIEPGKSFIRTIQSIGRGLRQAIDKNEVNIYDITSNCKYSKRHLTERKKFYSDAKYPFTMSKVQYTESVTDKLLKKK